MDIYICLSDDRRFHIGSTKDGIPIPRKDDMVTKHQITYTVNSIASIDLDSNAVYVLAEQCSASPLASAVLSYRKYLFNEGERSLYNMFTDGKSNGTKTILELFKEFMEMEKTDVFYPSDEEAWKLLRDIAMDLYILYPYYAVKNITPAVIK